jgi:putative membrane protein
VAIKNFSDHAANERTYLAWLRTGLAVIAFGIVVEKLNFLLTMMLAELPSRAPADSSLAPLAHLRPYEGLGLSLLGIAIVVVGGIRFARNTREIDSTGESPARSTRVEIALTGALALLAGALSLSLALT